MASALFLAKMLLYIIVLVEKSMKRFQMQVFYWLITNLIILISFIFIILGMLLLGMLIQQVNLLMDYL